MVVSVVKKRQFWVVISVVKKRQFCVVIRQCGYQGDLLGGY